MTESQPRETISLFERDSICRFLESGDIAELARLMRRDSPFQ